RSLWSRISVIRGWRPGRQKAEGSADLWSFGGGDKAQEGYLRIADGPCFLADEPGKRRNSDTGSLLEHDDSPRKQPVSGKRRGKRPFAQALAIRRVGKNDTEGGNRPGRTE